MGRIFARVAAVIIGVSIAMAVATVASGRDTTYPGGGAILGPGTPVSMTAPTSGEIMQALGSPVVWTPVAASAVVDAITLGGDLTGTPNSATVAKINGNPVAAGSPSAGQLLGWDGAQWTGENTTGNSPVAAVYTVTLKASNSFTVGNAWTVTNQGGRAVVFTITASGGQTGAAGGLNCSAWPCTYSLPGAGAGLSAAQTACLFNEVINTTNPDPCGLGGPFPTTGLGYTGVLASSTVTLTDSVAGAGTPITDNGISAPFAHTTQTAGANASTTALNGNATIAGTLALTGALTLTTKLANAQLANPSLTVTAGTGLTGGGSIALGASGTVSIANTAVTPATYGSATQVGQFTVDQQGRITGATGVSIALAAGAYGQSTRTTGYALTAITANTTGYFTPSGTPSATDVALVVVTESGTLRRFYCDAITAPGSGQSEAYTVRRSTNGTTFSDTTSTCTVSNTSDACNDTTHTVSLNAGDLLGIKGVQSLTSAAAAVTCTIVETN